MSLRLILTQAPPPKVSAYLLPLARLRAEGRAALSGARPIESGEVAD
jgi:hypothetical protein